MGDFGQNLKILFINKEKKKKNATRWHYELNSSITGVLRFIFIYWLYSCMFKSEIYGHATVKISTMSANLDQISEVHLN